MRAKRKRIQLATLIARSGRANALYSIETSIAIVGHMSHVKNPRRLRRMARRLRATMKYKEL